jgi:hypothetical protein
MWLYWFGALQPYNELDHSRKASEMEHEYVSKVMVSSRPAAAQQLLAAQGEPAGRHSAWLRRPRRHFNTLLPVRLQGQLRRFAQSRNVHVWLVAHPHQMQNWAGQAPTLMQASPAAQAADAQPARAMLCLLAAGRCGSQWVWLHDTHSPRLGECA